MTERQKGILALLVVLVAWSLSSVFVKYLIHAGYGPHTQNFYRYAAGTAVLVPFLLRRFRRTAAWPSRRTLLWLLAATVPNLSHQICWTVSLNWIHPGLSSFLNKSSVLFAALLAFTFYAEERWLLRSKRYIAGLVLTLLGTIGLSVLRGDLNRMQANVGVGLALLAGLSWATYSVMVKRPSGEVGSTVSFAIVGIYTTLVLLVIAIGWGELGHWKRAPWQANAIMIFSGVLCIGAGHTFYYYAMQRLTVSVCTTVLLTTPMGTLWISRWLFGERMTAWQIVSGLVLILGGILTLLAREKKEPSLIAQATEAAET
ncbi:MAG: DMT family transporter [Verrucomicrobiae bacterium]|nr:DMT family transporter [Verrucomicrobiae bacterium]